MQQARNPLFKDYLQTETSHAYDAQGRRVVHSNLFSTDVGQWHAQDVKIQTGREDAVPFFILAFSDGAPKTRRTSMHVLRAGLGNYRDFIRNSQAAKSHIMFFQKGEGKPATSASQPARAWLAG
jgi:hypothetical protein